MRKKDNLIVMICSHQRAATTTTYDVLRKQGYTGKIIIVLDDEDIITSLFRGGQRGELFLRIGGIVSKSKPIGNNHAGMQEAYERLSEYARSFIAVIVRPDCVKVRDGKQIQTSWKNAVPMIISERWKK